MKHHKSRKLKYYKHVVAGDSLSTPNPLAKSVVMSSISAAALVGMSLSSWAKDDTTTMPEVVVSGQQDKQKAYKPERLSSPKYTQPLRDTAQTITVVPKDVMQEQGATSLRDVLRNVPGISIQAGEGGVPAGDQVSIRGFSARTDMYVDGVRDFGGYSRDPFAVEQVEVAKGPSSTTGGRGSTGGSINLVSKLPQAEAFRNATIGVGSAEYQRYTVDVNQPLKINGIEGAAVRFNAMYSDSDVVNRDVAHNERWGIAPSVTFGLETPTRLTLSYYHLDQDNIPDYGIPFGPAGNIPLANYTNRPVPTSWENFYGLRNRDYERTKTDIATVIVDHDFTDEFSLRNLTRYGRNYRDSVVSAPRLKNTATTDVTREYKARYQVDSILSNQTDFTYKFDTFNMQHTLVPGIELNREVSKNNPRAGVDGPITGLDSPNFDATYAGAITRGPATKADSETIAVYTFDTLEINEHWQLNGGLRWEQFKTEYEASPTGSARTLFRRVDKMLSGKGGIVYKPVEEGSIYAAYGTSFNPAAEALTLGATGVTSSNLGPEESESYEIGTKWDLLKKKLALTFALFRTNKTNARTTTTDIPAVTILEGKQRVDGVELGATGSVTDDWKVFAGYTFMKSRIRASKNPLEVGSAVPNAPMHSFSIWNTYDLPANFQVGGGLQYVSSRGNSTTLDRRVPQYLLGSAMLAYEVNKNVTLRLNINNIADVEYADQLGGGHFVPGAGRTAILSSEFKF